MSSARPERGAQDDHRAVQFRANVSEAGRRELVNRIVHSPTFGRSERLGSLLTYICEMTFEGREGELNEQKIGQAVFDRRQDYDSAVDGIVRSQASRLRQRLELYFQQEGADEPLRIVIPRGGYVPVFEPQRSEAPAVADATERLAEKAPSVPALSTNILRKDSFLRRWGLSLVLGLMLVTLWVHDRGRQVPVAVTSQAHTFWSHLFRTNQSTMIVAPDSGLVLFHGLSGQDIDLKEYLEAGYRSELNGPPQIGPAAARKDWLLDLANRRYTSMVDVEAILTLKDRARTLGSDVSVRYARDLRPNDFKSGNVVLLGAASANPWVELFENKMNFALKDDYKTSFWVLNRSPHKDEPGRWETTRNDPERRVFGVVAYMPNLAGDGSVLILEGTSMSGTEAATDFVDDDAELLPFLNRIRRPDGTLPHFELLLETHNMGASAVRSQILAWRTMN
jgi:hypothetical protein